MNPPIRRCDACDGCGKASRMAVQAFTAAITLLHNPRCSKSRAAKALLVERGVTFEERLYLERRLDMVELQALRARLGKSPHEWVRKGESAYQEAALSSTASEDELLAAMAAHPVLIERPILITPTAAVVGRPPEAILAILAILD